MDLHQVQLPVGEFFCDSEKKKTSCTPWICTKFNSRLGNFFVFQKKRLRVPHGFAPKIIKNNVHSHLQIIYFFYNQNVFISRRKKKGAKGDSNPRPLAPKARIIPLDHWPFLHVKLEGFEPPTFGSGIRRATVAP